MRLSLEFALQSGHTVFSVFFLVYVTYLECNRPTVIRSLIINVYITTYGRQSTLLSEGFILEGNDGTVLLFVHNSGY